VREPKIFLFDEPLSNLDAELRVSMRAELAQLHRRLEATMIYVTHDQIEAMTMADKIVVLRSGRVEQVGPPLELYNSPANRFVAGFLGSPRMNFLPARVVTAEQGTTLLEVEDLGPVPTPPRAGLRSGDKVTLGIRPEHLEIVPGGTGATVQAVEQLGGLSYVRLSPHDIVAQIHGQTRLAADDTVSLRMSPDLVHLFDAEGIALPTALLIAA
jgi:multiple sugar transport system ATP-binding protein